MTHVPYKDYFLPDVIAQRVDIALDASTGAIPQVKAGKVRALGVDEPAAHRGPARRAGIAEAFQLRGDSWHGIFAPRGTPPQGAGGLAGAVPAHRLRRRISGPS